MKPNLTVLNKHRRTLAATALVLFAVLSLLSGFQFQRVYATNITDTIGNASGYGNYATSVARCWPIVASASGTLQTIGINLHLGYGTARLSIYGTYSSSKFSGLLGQSADTSVTTGWNDFDISGSVQITQTTQYWLCSQESTSSTETFRGLTTTPNGNGWGIAYGVFPDTSGVTTDQGNVPVNMRIIYTASSTTSSSSSSTSTASSVPTSTSTVLATSTSVVTSTSTSTITSVATSTVTVHVVTTTVTSYVSTTTQTVTVTVTETTTSTSTTYTTVTT